MTIINSVIKGKQPVIDTLNVTPTTSAQQITAPQGTDGYSPVNVSAVTSSIDANIVAGNIKNGVTILGVTGSYQGGGGSPYCIEYTKDANNVLRRGSSVIDLTGVTEVPEYSLQYSYYGNTNISGNLDFSDVTTVGSRAFLYAFYNCTGITGVDFSGLTGVGVYGFQSAFNGCTSLNSADFSNVTSVPIGSFNYAFGGCTLLTSADFSNVNNVDSQGFSYAFQGCTSLTSANFSNTNAIGNYGFRSAFNGCTSLTSANFSSVFKIDDYSFQSAFVNTSISSLSFNNLLYQTTARDTTFNNMLSGVTGCTVHFPADWQSEVSSWSSFIDGFGGTNTSILFDLPAITSLDFSSLTSFSDIPISLSGNTYTHLTSVDLSGVTSTTGGVGLFNGNTYIETVDLSGLTQLNGQVSGMFTNCTSLNSVDFSGVTILASTSEMFTGSGACSVDLSGITNITSSVGNIFSNAGIGSVDLSGVTTITGSCVRLFENCTSLTSVDLTGLTTINNYYACDRMFNNCTSLTSIDLSSLTTISGQYACTNMFSGTSITNVKFDNLSTVTGNSCLYDMFNNCSSLISVYFPKLTVGPDFTSQTRPQSFGQIFYSSSIEIIDLRNFRSCGDYGWLDNFMANTHYLTTVNVNALEHIGEQGARAMLFFANGLTGSTLKNIYFPMLTSFGTNPFYSNAFLGRLDLTIHFRKDMQATVQALPSYSILWGAGTGSSVVFDLAGTLTGADGNSYARSEKDSVYASETAGAAKTATAWSYNNTIYYTSGGAEPQVGDTIYSDSACTIAETTVDSIA